MPPIVRAHAGGFDEMLLVILPLIVFNIVYRLARGRVPEHLRRKPQP